MKKTLLIIGGILLLALLGVIIYFAFVSQQGIQPISDAGEEALVSGITFSSTMNNDISLTGERKLICGGIAPYSFSISNGYSDENPTHPRRSPNNNPLILWADKGDGGDCINYINVQGTFPKGKLEVTCNLKSYSSDIEPAYAYCSVNSVTKSASAVQSGGEAKTEIITLNTDNTNVKIESKVDVSALSYSLSEVTIKFNPSSTDPVIPPASGWGKFVSFLRGVLDKFLSLFTSQSIVGNVSVLPGSTNTYQVNLQTNIPDSDFSDGFGQVQYASYTLADSNNNRLSEGAWERVYGSYSKAVTLTVPSDSNKDYVLVGIITQMNGTYNFDTGTWSWTEETPIIHEEINIKTKYSLVTPVIPGAGGWAKFTAFLNSLLNWFKNLFS